MAKSHQSDVERDLQKLETGIKNLEAQYNMYFSGRLPKPPWEMRSSVEALVKRYDRGHIQNYGDRFKFQTLQSRWATLVDLWDKGLRAREEGRPGPFVHHRKVEEPKKAQSFLCPPVQETPIIMIWRWRVVRVVFHGDLLLLKGLY